MYSANHKNNELELTPTLETQQGKPHRYAVFCRIGSKLMVFFILSCLFLSISSCNKKNAKPEKPLKLDYNEQALLRLAKDAEIGVVLSGSENAVGFATKDPDTFMNLTVSVNNKHFKGSDLEIETDEVDDDIFFCSADGSIDYRVGQGEVCLVSVKEKDKTILTKLVKVPEAPQDIDITTSTSDSKSVLSWTPQSESTGYDIWIHRSSNFWESKFIRLSGDKNSYTLTEEEQKEFLAGELEPVNEWDYSFSDDILTVEITATGVYRYGKVLILTDASTKKSWRYVD
jgi:hypothetical protein